MAYISLVPWTGGLNLREHGSIADDRQLSIADDIVYDFDGARHKRGGQSRRTRNSIPGGKLDDHMTLDPPGVWTSTGSLPLTLVNSTEWRGTTSTLGLSCTLTRTYSPKFSTALTVRVTLQTTEILTSGAYFGFTVNPGSSGTVDQLSVRFSNEGIKLLTAAATYSLLSTSIGTFNDVSLPLAGRELYEIDKFHTWRFDYTSSRTVLIYFDETLIFTSNALTNGASSKDGVVSLEWVAGDSLDVSVDSFAVDSGAGVDESVVTALFDFPRVASNLYTTHRMISVVNGRVYTDNGSHVPTLISEGGNQANDLFSFASFKERLLIASTRRRPIRRWTTSMTLAEDLPGNPPVGSIVRVHKNRLWVAGDESNPSRLYWSGLLNDEVWTTGDTGDFFDSGYVDIDPDDGGIITGIGPSFHGELIVYKTTGIYRIQGDTFDDFVMTQITKAIGGVGHQAIQNVGNDQYFVSPYGVHSLETTIRFGDLENAFLSSDIRKLWNREVDPTRLNRAWAVNNERFDRYELLIHSGSDTTTSIFPNKILCLHYGLTDDLHPQGRWSVKLIKGGSMTMFVDEDGVKRAFVGGLDGFINRQDEDFQHDFPTYKATGTQVDV